MNLTPQDDQKSWFSGKNILVTGATGFIGSHLCDRLLNLGAHVSAVSRTNMATNRQAINWFQGDLSDSTRTQSIVRASEADLIFHLAGYPVGHQADEHVLPSFRMNLMTTVNMLTAASKVGCQRFVLAGSIEEPARSKQDVTPHSPYAAAKGAGSEYARMFHRLYGLPVVVLHICMVYGPGQYAVSKLVPYVILSLLRGDVPKLGSGKRKVDWIYVHDVVEGCLSAACAAQVEGQTIDVGTGKLVSIRSIVERIVQSVNPGIKPLFNTVPDRPFERVRAANAARAYAMMGWKSVIALDNGLAQTIEWYRNHQRQLR